MITMLVNNTYANGQTDGMKLYKKEVKKGNPLYTFAANKKDAVTKFNANITVNWFSLKEYLKTVV